MVWRCGQEIWYQLSWPYRLPGQVHSHCQDNDASVAELINVRSTLPLVNRYSVFIQTLFGKLWVSNKWVGLFESKEVWVRQKPCYLSAPTFNLNPEFPIMRNVLPAEIWRGKQMSHDQMSRGQWKLTGWPVSWQAARESTERSLPICLDNHSKFVLKTASALFDL